MLRNTITLLVITALIGLQACQKNELLNEVLEGTSPELKSSTMNTFYSSAVPVGNGVARAWIKQMKDGDPIAVGIDLNEKALMNLPDHPEQYVLELPKNKGHHFYMHALFDWNPGGHEPPGVYDVPHFDFHFYIIPNSDRLEIPGNFDEGYFDPPPAPEYVPPFYAQLPGLIPEMGAHWVNVTSPELHEVPFTHTFILGSYNGEFIFWEPMITREFLLSNPNGEFDIPQPEQFQNDGWYPETYEIVHSSKPGKYTIALTNLTSHNGE